MIEFLRVMLFSNLLLLTPHPIDIDNQVVIALKTPVQAITEGATVSIDVTAMLEHPKPYNLEWIEYLHHVFPSGSISAKLVSSNGDIVILKYNGHWLHFDRHVRLILGTDRVPINIQFTKVIIHTEMPLQNISAYWRNYAM